MMFYMETDIFTDKLADIKPVVIVWSVCRPHPQTQKANAVFPQRGLKNKR